MKKRVAFLLMMSCLITNLGACSSESAGKVDYDLDELENGSTEEGQKTKDSSGSTLAQFANEEDWVESFTVIREDGKEATITIDGEIRIPTVDYMSIVEVKVIEEEDLDWSVIEEMAYPVTKKFYDSSKDEETGWIHSRRTIYCDLIVENFGALHVSEEHRNEFLQYGSSGHEPSEENLCSYSMEEAEKLAADFLEKLGIFVSGYQIEEHSGLCWGDHPYGREYFMEDGHYISYVLKDDLGNDLITHLDNYINIGSLYTGTMYELDPQIKVYLVDQGIMNVNIGNPVQVIGSTKVTKYASFDTVKESLKTALIEEFDKVYIPRDPCFDTKEQLIINSIELIYFRIKVKGQEGYYSYIPVWRFCHQTELDGELIDESIYNPILVNALDGSVIYLQDEL